MPSKERYQRSFATLEKVADGKSEEPGQQQENNQEYVGDRRRKIAAELALHDRLDNGPGTHARTVSGSVIERNTSSRRPSLERAFNSCGVPLATILPRSLIMTRVHPSASSSSMWVENTTALF